MATWAFRPVLPAGSSFNGQTVYNMTNVEVPNTLKRYVESLEIVYADIYINKMTGFESKKYRIKNTTGTSIQASLRLTLIGSLPRWLQQLFVTIAKGCNGGGMQVDLYDDWTSDKQYTCRWVNAGDFIDNSELLCSGSLDLEAFVIQAV